MVFYYLTSQSLLYSYIDISTRPWCSFATNKVAAHTVNLCDQAWPFSFTDDGISFPVSNALAIRNLFWSFDKFMSYPYFASALYEVFCMSSFTSVSKSSTYRLYTWKFTV